MRLLHGLGAHVVFGDLNEAAARTLQLELSRPDADGRAPAARAAFVVCDVTSYDSVVELFETAWVRFGRVDHAAAIAGVLESGDVFELDGRGGTRLGRLRVLAERPPDLRTLDVNLTGTIHFARVAIAYLSDTAAAGGPQSTAPENTQETGTVQGSTGTVQTGSTGTVQAGSSLTLMGSAASFVACGTNIAAYTASKHGVLGVARALHAQLHGESSVRVNWLLPFATRSPMTEGLASLWEKHGLPWNEAEDVARVVGELVRDGTARGKGLYVESGQAWDVETALWEQQDQWWGKERRETFDKTRLILNGSL